MEDLAEPFSRHISEHLKINDNQGTSQSSRFLNKAREYNKGDCSKSDLLSTTVSLGFNNVIDAFHVIGGGDVPERFFMDERTERNGILITDNLLKLKDHFQFSNFSHEVEARWRLDEVIELSSFERVKVLVSHVVRLLGARTKIDSLTPEKIRDYRKKRKKEFLASRPGRNPSDTTINREVSAFKTMLNRGVANGIIDSNPIRFVPLLKENNVRERILNSDEFERLYDSADEHLKPVIMMAYFHPMRREEILKLTWDEVDLSGSVGMIRLSSERTKGKKQGRAIPLHPRMREILEQLRKKNCGERVFLRYGKPFNECKNSFEKAKSKAQIKDFRFHDFRHCAISNLRKAGNDYTTIMKASGHRTFSMFLRYNLVSHEELKKMKFSSGKNEKTHPMKQRLLSLGLDPEEVLSSLLHEKVS